MDKSLCFSFFLINTRFRLGKVYKGKYRGGLVAVKTLKSTDVSTRELEAFLDELELMV